VGGLCFPSTTLSRTSARHSMRSNPYRLTSGLSALISGNTLEEICFESGPVVNADQSIEVEVDEPYISLFTR
jgi:hypothetical protein